MRNITTRWYKAAFLGLLIMLNACIATAAPKITPDAATQAEEIWPETNKAIAKTRAVLEQPLDELACDKQPLEKAIQYLQSKTTAQLVVNWIALQGAGITKDLPVTAKLHDLPLRTVLEFVLSSVSVPPGNLHYTIDGDGVVVISTMDDLQTKRFQIERTYRITELLHARGTADASQREDAIKEIITAITSIIAPDTWRDQGGILGSIRELNGTLIITQTFENQEEVRQLLIQLATGQLPVTKAYDVWDIIYKDGNHGIEDKFAKLEALIKLHNTLKAWEPDGPYSMSEYDGKLYISAPEAMHVKIKALLDLVKQNMAAK